MILFSRPRHELLSVVPFWPLSYLELPVQGTCRDPVSSRINMTAAGLLPSLNETAMMQALQQGVRAWGCRWASSWAGRLGPLPGVQLVRG